MLSGLKRPICLFLMVRMHIKQFVFYSGPPLLVSVPPDWFDATVRLLLCLDVTVLHSDLSHRSLTSHFMLRSTWSAADKRAGLELFIVRHNKSAEFNMGSALRASGGSQSQSPPVETSISPQTVSDGFTESFDCFDRRARPRFIERYDKNFGEGIYFTTFSDFASVEFVRHLDERTGDGGRLNEICNKTGDSGTFTSPTNHRNNRLLGF